MNRHSLSVFSLIRTAFAPLWAPSMKNPLKAMASFMKKFKRKRRLSSELHSRWGDPSISYPTQGSWNQPSQSPSFFVNAPTGLPQSPRPAEQKQQQQQHLVSLDHSKSHDSNNPTPQHTPNDTSRVDSVIPKGYFNENIRHREKGHRSPALGLGIAGTRHDRNEPDCHDVAVDDDESCDGDDEERDTLGDPKETATHRNYATGDASRLPYRDDYDSCPDHPAKSPPLSVTSRMRRISTQSSMTEHSSIIGPASSRRTSYTAASSVSAPSLPPDTPRYAVHAQFEKRVAPRPRYRTEPAPAVGVGQGMVPSYDELYG